MPSTCIYNLNLINSKLQGVIGGAFIWKGIVILCIHSGVYSFVVFFWQISSRIVQATERQENIYILKYCSESQFLV